MEEIWLYCVCRRWLTNPMRKLSMGKIDRPQSGAVTTPAVTGSTTSKTEHRKTSKFLTFKVWSPL